MRESYWSFKALLDKLNIFQFDLIFKYVRDNKLQENCLNV